MLDFSILTREPRRWLCTSCDAEGRGQETDACPYCGSDAVWGSAEYGTDLRTMREIACELVEMVDDIRRWSYLQ
ncbi:hypothetical protein [Mesorhizobium sp. B2-4-17]|uniref:hypothetical protein n=1 Tax=Mesorhizobium sp. B2-4-17 TaxID=2589932 RepID=UPI0011260063|nr:hypothetical protein [Mesorhizobium sp. B2-4-17]TPK78202.1 hypothetical protein FJ548_25040 [Mesorhizobium sp. B2-4-17]